MEKKLLKIGMLTVVLIFVFTGASWADGRKNRHHSDSYNSANWIPTSAGMTKWWTIGYLLGILMLLN